MKDYRTKIGHLTEEHENDELWAISYGDMITLLLSFFVIFFSTDFKKEKERQDKLDSALIVNLKDKNQSKAILKKENGYEVFKTDIFKNAKLTKVNDTLYVSFDKTSFFKSGSVNHLDTVEPILNDFYAKYIPYSALYKLEVKAFTDNMQVKRKKNRKFDDNLELSTLRALNIIKYFQKKGIPLNKMELAGYGEYDKLKYVFTDNELLKMTKNEKNGISRTIILIIKPINRRDSI